MEQTSTETVVPDNRDETFAVGGEESEEEEYNKMCQRLDENVSQHVQENPDSTNIKLFSYLALLNAYIPESYLLMSECQKILGPPDPIHGGPPFEERMEPFTIFIDTSSEHVRMIHPGFAQRAVEQLADIGISRSATVKKLMFSLCGAQPEADTIHSVKDLLTKRQMGEKGKEKFSRLIDDIWVTENFYNALSVLKTASNKLRQNPIFPQTVSRLYYIRRGITDYENALEWAKRAIRRAPNNSYVADTLGQVYKNRLMRTAKNLGDILNMAKEAFKAFKDVEMKADKEEGPEMKDTTRTVSISNSFNNRGLFGFIQVAKITLEKLSEISSYRSQKNKFIKDLKMDVEDKFDFFEWYLTYSKPHMTTLEPCYFWKDIAICYEHFTTTTAAESTSFPGLLDRLNRGLFTSKGRRAEFEETEVTVSDLEAIQEALKTTYETNVDDVKAVERYIVSNIILSNKMPDSPQLTPVKELQTIIYRFLGTEVGRRSPEFYLLVLLLFWPEREPQMVQDEGEEEVEHQATEDDGSDLTKTWEDEDGDEEQETRQELAQPSPDVVFDPDLQQQVTFMEQAFERAGYAKYLRGRYLLPLFFLGNGSGLSKWIHKARLDAIVEEKVSAELADKQDKGEKGKKKWSLINEMWVKGKVWQVPEIQDILLPVQIEPCYPPTMPQEHEEQKVFVNAGGKKIVATVGAETASVQSPVLFYLGFTIQGPVVFKVGLPLDSD